MLQPLKTNIYSISSDSSVPSISSVSSFFSFASVSSVCCHVPSLYQIRRGIFRFTQSFSDSFRRLDLSLVGSQLLFKARFFSGSAPICVLPTFFFFCHLSGSGRGGSSLRRDAQTSLALLTSSSPPIFNVSQVFTEASS